MVNPINTSPVALPVDLQSAELPVSMSRPAVGIPPSEHASNTGTATTGNRQDSFAGSGDTPLDKTLEQLNNSMQAWATGMRFDVDEDAQRVVVSIVDTDTGEVLRTVPTEAVIRVAKMIVQLQGGTIDVRA